MRNEIVNIASKSPVMAAGEDVNVFLFGDIGKWYSVNEKVLINALSGKNAKNVNIYLSTNGGAITTAFVIHDLLKSSSANVTCYLTGICASSGTIIACGADRVVSSPACVYMTHKPIWGQYGNADELRSAAATLDVYQGIILSLYKAKTNQPDDVLSGLMNATTWMEPADAVRYGFVDEIGYFEIDWASIPPPVERSGYSDWDWLYDYSDTDKTWTGQKCYSSSIVNCLENGFEYHSPELPAQKTTSMSFAKRIIDFLQGKNFIPEDQAENATTALLEMDLVKEVTEASQKQFGEVTMERVVDVISNLSEDQKATLFPKPDTSALEAKVEDLTRQLAEAVTNRSVPPAASNGQPPVAQEPTEGPLTKAQKDYLEQAYKAGKISKEVYDKAVATSTK